MFIQGMRALLASSSGDAKKSKTRLIGGTLPLVVSVISKDFSIFSSSPKTVQESTFRHYLQKVHDVANKS